MRSKKLMHKFFRRIFNQKKLLKLNPFAIGTKVRKKKLPATLIRKRKNEIKSYRNV